MICASVPSDSVIAVRGSKDVRPLPKTEAPTGERKYWAGIPSASRDTLSDFAMLCC